MGSMSVRPTWAGAPRLADGAGRQDAQSRLSPRRWSGIRTSTRRVSPRRSTTQLNDKLSLFGNFGQYVYQQFSPNDNSGSLGFANYDGYQFAWQGGVNYKFGDRKSAKVAVGFYNYYRVRPSDLQLSSTNPELQRVRRPLCQGPAEYLPTTLGHAGLAFNNGVNNLRYCGDSLGSQLPARRASMRASSEMSPTTPRQTTAPRRAATAPGQPGSGLAAGLAVGTNMGLTMNQVAAKKNTGRRAPTGSKSISTHWIRISSTPTSSKAGPTCRGCSLRLPTAQPTRSSPPFASGKPIASNANGPTPGSNPDIPNVQPITSYKLLQFDLTWKF